ncbi:MAG: SMP-30/gluconolactonase/LRE family protein [Sphingomonas sp.]|uniref:SMP-30/gluconolactonase/LRE family protein n=1 Tax=Sphingomonas sp. TaxID=28214 RepID=UPI00356884A1
MASIERIHAGGDSVGESALWCERTGRIIWVDIVGQKINALTPVSGQFESWDTPDLPTSIGLCANGEAVVGLRRAVTLWDWQGDFRPLAIPEPDLADNRLNEGKVGPDGAFWVGTMQDNIGPDGEPVTMNRSSGAIYRVWRDGRVDALTPREFGICNTMAWTVDGGFRCADTLADELYFYPMGRDGLGERRRLLAGGAPGLPDGSALDRDGGLWNCRVGGGCVMRITPEGHVDRVIELPCSQPTSCAFGGPGLTTLFVTSARFGLPADERASPNEGALYALDIGVSGTPEFLFG